MVLVTDRVQRRRFDLAAIECQRAPRMEMASSRRRRGARDLSGDRATLPVPLDARVRDRDHGEERTRVGVRRIPEERVSVGKLDDAAEIHDRDAVAHVPNDAEIVADEDEGQAALDLESLQQVEDLRSHRDVERRRAFVRDHNRGVECKRTRNADSLSLTAAQLLRAAT